MRFRDDDDHKREIDNVNKLLAEANQQERLYLTDSYDQSLLDLKRLINRKAKAPEKQYKIYDTAIEILINDIHELGHVANMPHSEIKRDINQAMQGGRYRELFKPRDSDDIIDIGRKKKSSKPKPKRKVKKIVKKKPCGCK